MSQDNDRIIRLGTQQEEAVFLQYARGMDAAFASGHEFQHWVNFFLAYQTVSPLERGASATERQYVMAVERRNNGLRPQLRLRVELLRLGGYPFPVVLAPNGGQAAPVVPAVPGMFTPGPFPVAPFLPRPPAAFRPTLALPPFAPDFTPISLPPGVQLPPGAAFPPNPPTTPALLTFSDPTTPSAIGTPSQAQAHRVNEAPSAVGTSFQAQGHHVNEAASAVGTSSQAQAHNVNETHDETQTAEAHPSNASPNACLIESNREFFMALREALALIVAGHNAVLCNCAKHGLRD